MAAKTKSPCKLRLSGELTVRTIAEAHHKLMSACAKNDSVLIDASAVEETDLTLVQLIVAARRSSIDQGKHLALNPAPSTTLREVLQRGGFLDATEGSSFWKGE